MSADVSKVIIFYGRCTDCDWTGPDVDNQDAAYEDAVAHEREGCAE